MIKRMRKRSWKSDIIKTQDWLNQMHMKGYALKNANLRTGKFVFEALPPEKVYYRIGYWKDCSGAPRQYLGGGYFEEVCHWGNYYIIKTKIENPPLSPPYDEFWERNVRRKSTTGTALLIYTLIIGIILTFMFIFSLVGLITGNLEYGGFIAMCVLILIFTIPIWVLSSKFNKYRRADKALEAAYGNPLSLSWQNAAEPEYKKEIKKLKKEKRYYRKTRLWWFFSPDITGKWLEEMEAKGFNLLKMSTFGGSFHFIKGKPRKAKYHIDYQRRTDLSYYTFHKENGWKLFFTTSRRSQTFTVWGQEYVSEAPLFYSDKQSVLKYAKNLALTYALTLLALGIVYLTLLALQIINLIAINKRLVQKMCKPPKGNVRIILPEEVFYNAKKEKS